MTVRRLLEEIDSAELTEWQAYHHFDPFGLDRGDRQAGLVSSTILNLFRGKDERPISPEDQMPDYGGLRREEKAARRKARAAARRQRGTAREMSLAESREWARAWALRMGGTVVEKGQGGGTDGERGRPGAADVGLPGRDGRGPEAG